MITPRDNSTGPETDPQNDATHSASGSLLPWSRAFQIAVGAILLAGGAQLSLSGPTGWCPIEGMPDTLTKIVGSGLAVFGGLLFFSRTAVFGLLAGVAWVVVWGWALAGTLWGRSSCWQSALALGVLFSSMGMTGNADRRHPAGRATKLMVFFAVTWLATAFVLWLRAE